MPLGNEYVFVEKEGGVYSVKRATKPGLGDIHDSMPDNFLKAVSERVFAKNPDVLTLNFIEVGAATLPKKQVSREPN